MSALPRTSSLIIGLSTIVAALVLRFGLWYFRARRQFPGPPVKNIWTGNLDEVLSDQVHEKWREWHNTYGPIYQTWSGMFSRTIYIGDPALISKIAIENWPKFHSQYKGFKPLSGQALFMQMNQDRWRWQRKSLAPAFGPAVVNGQLKSLQTHIQKYKDILDIAVTNSETVDLSRMNVLLTLDFVGEVAFGIDLQALKHGSGARILTLFEDILPELMKCGLFPLRAKIPVCASTRRMHAAIAELRGMAEGAVKNVRRHNEQHSVIEKPEKRIFEILAGQRDAAGKYMFSTSELVDNYVTFLVAGGDPTAHAITFAIYAVTQNPEILLKLQKELDSVIPDNQSIQSIDQVKLPYLNMVIKETLRLYGPGFGTFRYCAKDTEINGVTLPANTSLALWNPQVHHDKRLWGPDADQFVPERWSSGKASAPSGSFFPFSYGPRNCLGQGLAMLEMSLTLATLFRSYEFTFEEGYQMELLPSFTLCAKNGLQMKVAKRG